MHRDIVVVVVVEVSRRCRHAFHRSVVKCIGSPSWRLLLLLRLPASEPDVEYVDIDMDSSELVDDINDDAPDSFVPGRCCSYAWWPEDEQLRLLFLLALHPPPRLRASRSRRSVLTSPNTYRPFIAAKALSPPDNTYTLSKPFSKKMEPVTLA